MCEEVQDARNQCRCGRIENSPFSHDIQEFTLYIRLILKPQRDLIQKAEGVAPNGSLVGIRIFESVVLDDVLLEMLLPDRLILDGQILGLLVNYHVALHPGARR